MPFTMHILVSVGGAVINKPKGVMLIVAPTSSAVMFGPVVVVSEKSKEIVSVMFNLVGSLSGT